MTLVLKRRKFRPLTLTGQLDATWGSTVYGSTNHVLDIAEHQLTWSESHPWPKGKGSAEVGGPFETIRTRYNANYDLTSSYNIQGISGYHYKYNGNILTSLLPDYLGLRKEATESQVRSAAGSLGDSTLGSMGATAISYCAPTAPAVDGSVALAELFREGIPSLVGVQLFRQRARTAKAAGGEYLNLQFGWLPLISDIRATAQAVVQTEAIVSQLIRDSGKNVRRRYDFPVQTENVQLATTINQMPWPGLYPAMWTVDGIPPFVHTYTKRSVWFEGCFTYYVDPQAFRGLQGAARQARHIYGLQLTPDVLWNASPWSWLVDWVINVGPVLKNVGLFAQDGLTLRYGYTMENTIKRHTTRYPKLRSAMGGALPSNPTFVFHCESKKRIEQSPYVLGLTGAEFTLRRAAILTALGLTKFA